MIDGREFGVEPICKVLFGRGGRLIAPSTYYAAKARPTCARVSRDAELLAQIRRVHATRNCGSSIPEPSGTHPVTSRGKPRPLPASKSRPTSGARPHAL
jgi:hypothetical protein